MGVAVNVTEVPETDGLLPEVMAMDTAGVTGAEKLIVMPLLVAVVGLAQEKLEVRIQVTICPAVNVEVVYVTVVTPVLTPFTCQL